jgi:hypothetical protein
VQKITVPFFSKKWDAEQAGPSQQTHPPNATPFPVPIHYDDPHPGVYDSSSPSNNETVFWQRGSNDHNAAPSHAMDVFQDGTLLCGFRVLSLISMSIYTVQKQRYNANSLPILAQRSAATPYPSHQFIPTPSEIANAYSNYHHQMAPNSRTPEPPITFKHVSQQQQRGEDSDDMKEGKQRYYVAVGAPDDERREERQGMVE